MAISRDMAITRTAKQDAESLCCTFVYAVYKMALGDQTYGAHSLLEAEFMVPFAIIEIQDVLDRRRKAFDGTEADAVPGIQRLQDYLTHTNCDVFRECVEYVWMTLFRLQQNIQLDSQYTPKPGYIKSNRLLKKAAGEPDIALLPPPKAPEYKDPTSDLISVFQQCIQTLKESHGSV